MGVQNLAVHDTLTNVDFTDDVNFDNIKSFYETMAKAKASELETAHKAGAERELYRQSMLKFVRISLALFKRCPHADTCPAVNNLTAICDCGLEEILQELTKQTAAVVFESMTTK